MSELKSHFDRMLVFTQELLDFLNSNASLDDKFERVEHVLNLRHELIEKVDDIQAHGTDESDKGVILSIQKIDAEIEKEIKNLMNEYSGNASEIKDKKIHLGKVKVATKKYLNYSPQKQGYFIDKKK